MNRLALVKAEFAQAVLDVAPGLLDGLDERIERARSLREFWHLRAPLYGAVAMGLNQIEADRRLSGLNRHFPHRATRNGGAAAVASHVAPRINAATLAAIESAASRRPAPAAAATAATGQAQPRPEARVRV